jgi:hypothetical protein
MPQSRQLALLVTATLLLIMVLVTLVVGLISPFWCDVTGVNYLTCSLKTISSPASSNRYVNEFPLETTTPEQVTESADQQQEAEPTVMVYQDLEAAAEDDPALTEFLNTLKTAVETKDHDTISTLISDPFNVGPYGSSYAVMNHDEAIAWLTTSLDEINEPIILDITNDSRTKAQQLGVTPREASFALVAYGWPFESISILGVRQTPEGYVWTDLIYFVNEAQNTE